MNVRVKGWPLNSGDWGRIRNRTWYIPVVLLMPAVTGLAYGLMYATGRAVRPPVAPALALFPIFLIAALGEELGWSAYALDPMQRRWTPLRAALLLGVIWALWHVIAMVQAGQSAVWIAWGCLDMVATRVLMVWIYNGAGKSVFAVALYHAIANLSIKTLFPGGSYEAERLVSLILVGVAVSVILVHRRPRGPLPFSHGGRVHARP